jgi:hypothetical protein
MKIHDVQQNTPEWLALRIGIPTASAFDKILTPTGKPSTQAEAYADLLLAEIMVGGPVEVWQGNQWTERGHELEQEAADYYAMTKGVTLKKVGFITDDEMTMGCSPDRVIEGGGLLEIKCPAPHTHVKYLLKQEIDQGYRSQLMGQLLISGEPFVDIISYYPAMPSVIMRVERDGIYLANMRKALNDFNKMVAEKKARMIELGYLS